MKKIFLIFGLIFCACTLYATTAAKGVFSVSSTKTVQFANANESGLKQWSDANAWSEAHKDDDGHNGWYVLDHEEWTYLMVDRDGEGMSKNNIGTVDGKYGLIILPDGWEQPAGVPEYAATPWSFATNVYTASQWTLMEQSGAVFLPCQGYSENGVDIIDASDHGRYWASDQYDSDKGYNISTEEGTIHNQNTFPKTHYYSVILVKNVTPTYLDEQDYSEAFGTKLGTADDYNFALVKRTLNKDGTFYTLCLPFDVPNIDASPLVGADVYEFAGGTVGGSKGSEVLYLNLTRLSGKRLTQGVPYLLNWSNTGEHIDTLRFYNVENWDNNTTTADDPGNGIVNFHGVYPKAHIPGYASGDVAHYNFFLGAENTLYWPDDTTYPAGTLHDMKGFRAYFYIVTEKYPFSAPSRHSMQTVWNISGGFGAATGIQNTDRFTDRVQTEKLMRDGQIVLVIDGKEFDLQGKQIK